VEFQKSSDQRTVPQFPIIEPLSLQEERVLSLLVSGFSYQEIAQELWISINTVKTHVKSVYRKLNVRRRREARDIVRRYNLL
jgi:LuxR family maltose regulon positive regulatory protein